MLCVAVSNSPELNVTETQSVVKREVGVEESVVKREAREWRQAEEEEEEDRKIMVVGGDVINVLVLVEDIDDNGPSFGASVDGQQATIIAGKFGEYYV